MKIKEVIAQTGLTDRAIRLYIENELVTPSFSENYKGRKSIDFSENDVKNLKNIATLRKAGFSIAEIKEIRQGGEKCRKAVTEFIDKTSERIEADKEILKSLQSVVAEDEITLEAICDRLNMPTAQKSVPKEDSEADTGERYRTFGFLSLGIWLSFVIIQLLSNLNAFNFPSIYDTKLFWTRLLLHAFTAGVSILLIIINKKTKRKKRKRKPSKLSFGLACVLILTLQLMFFNMLFASFFHNMYSMTSDPKNYLKLDSYVELYSQDIYDLFPAHIPRSATVKTRNLLFSKTSYPDTTKYYYRHRYFLDPDFDIVAEWALPEENFEYAKEKALTYVDEITYQQEKGDWKCIYYNEKNQNTGHDYYYLMFAYNEEAQTVRYIISYCMDTAGGRYTPYFLSLDW